ncbi:hypothetical protein HF086_002192 [Spodoptera exigua]|uniref:Protein AF-10 n=1 Tax=Spodoptera exigua TaxID=7107 RepID=A0A922MGH8_SPOEX|nr:hypothetical protein HF086_002192 [Spodoptera exigua]
MKEMVGGCCVCSDERGWPDNPLVYCDGNGCTVAVHQACYGIVTVPTGPWFCRKCESPETKNKVRCELCPSKSGALKRSDTGGWAHVVCALYIPEVRFGNVTSMEPIVLRLIPPERYNKTCYICQDLGKTHRANAGACMQCNKSGCKQQFHVTCAQGLGLLCEEAGNYLDNVKYCGYCQHHYSKLVNELLNKNILFDSGLVRTRYIRDRNNAGANELCVIRCRSLTVQKKGGNVKTIPPYKPVSHDSQSSDSSCEKEGEPSCSPKASGGATPTHTGKSKGPGRKSSSHATSTVVSGKSTPNASKTPNQNQMMGNTPVPASVVQVPTSKPTYQESVITNTDLVETKQTKKRKAIAAANNMNAPVDYTNNSTPPVGAKTEGLETIPVPTSHFASVSPAPPPPPPPAHSPASNPSPRHLPSPMPGPSGINQVSNIRSPSNPQVQSDMPGPSPHIFHQPQKQVSAAMDTGMTGHSPHAIPGRSWGGLNVAYELQDPNKAGMSGMPGPSKQPDMGPVNMAPMPPTTPTPPPIYSETIKDSPPSSPSSERPLKPKMETKTFMYPRIGASCTAPHMLGNELNPESGAAACLQEQLTAELAAHAAGSAGGDTLIPPPLINKAAPGGSISSGRSSSAQSLDQLLERQWEQGSQFLMEQAQHFDKKDEKSRPALSMLIGQISSKHSLDCSGLELSTTPEYALLCATSLITKRKYFLLAAFREPRVSIEINMFVFAETVAEMVLGERCTNSSDVPLRSDDWPARAEPVHARKWAADDAGPAAAAAGARRRDYHVGPPTPGTTRLRPPREAQTI